MPKINPLLLVLNYNSNFDLDNKININKRKITISMKTRK